MIYLDVILTDEPDSIEITGTKEHQWMGLKDVLKTPKVSLFMLWRLKKFLETSYERINKATEETQNLYVQGKIRGVGISPDVEGEDAGRSTTEPEAGVERD